ncbi:MAG: anaerobic ribonucleoside-triphosphate reductase activating protein [Coriobacteriales bacterium]|nr:anaerobic ribonucleoside-triphosphate reductase activating protein [Coriobacteriales bacterium]
MSETAVGTVAEPLGEAQEEAQAEPLNASQTEPSVVTLYGTADDSIVDGPGIRFAVFTQGCKHDCLGCHNPKAQPFEGGIPTTTDVLWQKVEANPLLAGITLTGGEPFEQAAALVELARRTREKGLTVWAYSGYRFENLLGGTPNEAAPRLLEQVDVLVDGLFVERLKSLELTWCGSSNQRLIDVPASLAAGRVVEWQQEKNIGQGR